MTQWTIAAVMDDSSDNSMKQAVQLAVSHNQLLPNGDLLGFTDRTDGGIDTQGNSNLMNLLGDDRVLAAIGPRNSGVARYELQNAFAMTPNPFALISPSTTNPCLTVDVLAPDGTTVVCHHLDNYPMGWRQSFFRLCFHDRIQARVLAGLAVQRQYGHIYIVDDGDTFGTSFADWFEEALNRDPLLSEFGATSVRHSGVPPMGGSLNALVTDILTRTDSLRRPVDLIFYAGLKDTGGSRLKQAISQETRRRGLPPLPMAGGGDIVPNPAWLTSAGAGNDAGNTFGVACGLALDPHLDPRLDPHPVNNDAFCRLEPAICAQYTTFMRDFRSMYGSTPSTDAMVAYDATMVAITAIQRVLTVSATIPPAMLRTSVRDAVATSQYLGITGLVGFDGNGDRLGACPFTVWESEPDASGNLAWSAKLVSLTPFP
jgi:ABC-type branched-subunit amino acid transport system substrate-binding protein